MQVSYRLRVLSYILQSSQSRSPEMAIIYAEGDWKRHHPRENQGIPVEDTEEWSSRPWVSFFPNTFYIC